MKTVAELTQMSHDCLEQETEQIKEQLQAKQASLTAADQDYLTKRAEMMDELYRQLEPERQIIADLIKDRTELNEYLSRISAAKYKRTQAQIRVLDKLVVDHVTGKSDIETFQTAIEQHAASIK